MSIRATIHIGGHPVTVEADTPGQLTATVRAMLAEEPKRFGLGDYVAKIIAGQNAPAAAEEFRGNPGTFPGSVVNGSASDDVTRNPRGMNRKLVLQALLAAGQSGVLQAHVQQWIKNNKGTDLAVSSVRHALNQLQERGSAMRTGDVWRISGAGISALAEMEEADRKARNDLDDLIR